LVLNDSFCWRDPITSDNRQTTCREETRVAGQPPCATGAGRVSSWRGLSSALPLALVTCHIADTRTGTTTRAAQPSGHASETRAAEDEEDDDDDDDDDDDEERRGGGG